MKNLTLPLAVFAGFIGGTFSHYLLPGQPAPTQAVTPTVVTAKSFAIVDEAGKPIGVFAAGSPSTSGRRNDGRAPPIALYDADGKEVWRAGGVGQPLRTAQ